MGRPLPRLQPGEYVFCTVKGALAEYAALDPIACFREAEGLTLVLPVAIAVREGFDFDGTFRRITLTVYSSLHAVGLTAAVSERLASVGIPANIIAAYHHDHVFVPSEQAEEALQALRSLSVAAR
ncbi:ACT domain-containing protein [Arhodomonas sp. SL1]|uniref:ACT domain-containing protein n=1 Tax=Arhodomonas sp. SL1 TaxID=3425691 RepID=UPI003F885B1D